MKRKCSNRRSANEGGKLNGKVEHKKGGQKRKGKEEDVKSTVDSDFGSNGQTKGKSQEGQLKSRTGAIVLEKQVAEDHILEEPYDDAPAEESPRSPQDPVVELPVDQHQIAQALACEGLFARVSHPDIERVKSPSFLSSASEDDMAVDQLLGDEDDDEGMVDMREGEEGRQSNSPLDTAGEEAGVEVEDESDDDVNESDVDQEILRMEDGLTAVIKAVEGFREILERLKARKGSKKMKSICRPRE